jgi:general secretion pathway protein L
MADAFVLRLSTPNLDAPAEWVAVDSGGARLGNVSRGTLADAAAAAAGRRVIALVPGADVVLAQPELPVRTQARLLQLAPVALEENLAADIESLHFAVGRAGLDRRVPVAAVDRARFRGWLEAMRAAGLDPAAVYPDSLVVPANPAHVVLLLDGDRVYVRRPGALPVALEADPMDAALLVAGLPPSDAAEAEATHLMVYASPADWERARPAVEALRERIGSSKVQLLPDGPLPVYAATAVTEPPFSLLQGEFTVRQGFAGQWHRWRLAASLLGVFVALHLLTLGVDWWRVNKQEREADQQLTAAASEALPGTPNVERIPNLRTAVDNRLRGSRSVTGAGLIGTLDALAVAAPGVQVESLSYRDGVTDLTLDAPDMAAFDRVQQVVTQLGFQATMQGVNQRDQRYQGRMQLRGPVS